MDLNVLAKNIVIADLEIALFSSIGFVLRGIPEDDSRMDFIIFPDLRPTCQVRMGHDPRSPLDPDGSLDHHIGANLGFRINLGAPVNHGCRMNSHKTAA